MHNLDNNTVVQLNGTGGMMFLQLTKLQNNGSLSMNTVVAAIIDQYPEMRGKENAVEEDMKYFMKDLCKMGLLKSGLALQFDDGRMTESVVAQYYDACSVAEDGRLRSHEEEFEVTLATISEYSRPGLKVLDIGGGTGIYSVELSKMRCNVLMADISKACVDLAKKNAAFAGVKIDTMVADAMDRSIDLGGEYDLILCMGPLYHCANAMQAERIVFNVMDRLRDGGIAIFAFLSRYSKFNDMATHVSDCLDADIEFLEEYLQSCTHSDSGWSFETRGILPVSFVFPESIECIFQRMGLRPKEIFAVDAFRDKKINRGNAKRFLSLARGAARKLCLVRGNHILTVVQKGDKV